MLDMTRAREVFEASQDFTVGLEEEFAILDGQTRSLEHRYEELRDAAQEDEVLRESVAGELIESEIEIRSGRGETIADANARQHEARVRLFRLAESRGLALGATGTHPWSTWQEQRIIDTDPRKIGKKVNEQLVVRPFEELGEVVEEDEIVVGVIAVPTEAAQGVADELVDAGVTIIFNYSEALLQVPPEVTVHTSSPAVDLLYALYFYLT